MDEEITIGKRRLPLVIGVDLGGTQIRVAVLHGSRLHARMNEDTGANPTPDRIIPRIYHLIQKVLDQSCIGIGQIAGIGLGVAGPLDSRTGVVFDAPNLSQWHNVALREIFQERYHLPIYVENDANAAALGEYMFGAGQGSKHMVYLTISTGIGGGVIVDGQIVRGTNGTAGELGHMTIDWRGERCNCGSIGCLESIASGTAITRRAQRAIRMGQGKELLEFMQAFQRETEESVRSAPSTYEVNNQNDNGYNGKEIPIFSAQEVAQAAKAGITLAVNIIKDAAEALGIGLTNIIHIFNPEKIILGGGVTQIGPLLMEPILKVPKERAMKIPYNAARVVPAQFDGDAGLIGAGALIYMDKQKDEYALNGVKHQLDATFALP